MKQLELLQVLKEYVKGRKPKHFRIAPIAELVNRSQPNVWARVAELEKKHLVEKVGHGEYRVK